MTTLVISLTLRESCYAKFFSLFSYVMFCIGMLGPWTSIVGFGLAGLGVSNLLLMAYSQAGKSINIETPVAIAINSVFSYGAFMLAPPLEGLIADSYSLPAIFLALIILFLPLLIALNLFDSWRLGARELPERNFTLAAQNCE